MVALYEHKFISLKLFINYVISKINIQNSEEIYRIYISDCLRILTENTAKFGGGSAIKKRYIDLLPKEENKNSKNVDEVIANVVAKCGLKIGGK